MQPDPNWPKIHNLDLNSFQIQPGRLGVLELVSLILSRSGCFAVCPPLFLVSLFLLNRYQLINLPEHSIKDLTKLTSPRHLISEKLIGVLDFQIHLTSFVAKDLGKCAFCN